MAANTWTDALADNNGDDGGNWSAGWVPKAGDTATWDATSVANCGFAGNVACDAMDLTGAYSGLVSTGGFWVFAVTTPSTINGSFSIGVSGRILMSNAQLSIGSSADVFGNGQLRLQTPQAGNGIVSFAVGGQVRCGGGVWYYGPRTGAVLAAGDYEAPVIISNRADGVSGSVIALAGTFSFASLKLETLDTTTLLFNLATNDPTVTVQTLTFTISSSGNVELSPGANGLIVQGDIVRSFTSTGGLVANGCPITGTGSSNRDWDGCDATFGATEIIVTGAGTVTFVDDWTCSSFTLTDGNLDIGTYNVTLTASGAVSFAAGSTLADATGATVDCDTISFDGQSVTGLTINATTSGTATGTTFAGVTFNGPGGAKLDATDGTNVDGEGNSGIDFGVVVSGPFRAPFSPAFVGAFG